MAHVIVFYLKVLLLKSGQTKFDFVSFIKDLTSIFTHRKIKSCCIVHPSGADYHLIGQNERNKSHQDIPAFGDSVDPVTWKGFVELNVHDFRKHWIILIRKLCYLPAYKPFYRVTWSFDEDWYFLNEIGSNSDMELDELSIHSFSFGNIINVNHFIIHFGVFWDQPPVINFDDSRNTEVSMKNIKMKHDCSKKKFVLKFILKTTTGDTISGRESKYHLYYDYKSIKRVLICYCRYDKIRLYFQHRYPPRIFVNGLEIKSGVSKRIRTNNFGYKFPSDIIGNSDVLRLVLNIEDDSIITNIYRWQKYHHFDIFYGPMHETYGKPFHPKYKQDFPFSVNYALNCIYSIDRSFHDDLRRKDGRLKTGHQIIQKYIKDNKEELIVEALYRLFDDYLIGKVYNAIGHFKSLLSKIESKPKYLRSLSFSQWSINYALSCIHSLGYSFHDDLRSNHEGFKVFRQIIRKYMKGKKGNLVVKALYLLYDDYLLGKVHNAIEHLKLLLTRVESEWMIKTFETRNGTHYQSWAIVTPTRTIYTPAVAYGKTGYLIDHLIRVIVRDEDIDLDLLDRKNYHNLSDQIPYRKRSNSNYQFLSSFVGKKAIKLGCLATASRSDNLPKIVVVCHKILEVEN